MNVKVRTRTNTDADVYANWFNSVPEISADGVQMITVTVTDGTDPVAGANVMLGDGSMAATNAEGKAIFSKAAGTYDLFVSCDGYGAESDTVTVASTAVTKTITLTAA